MVKLNNAHVVLFRRLIIISKKRYDIKFIIVGVVLYFLSIYIVPLILVFLLASEPFILLRYEEVISIIISLGTLLLLGVFISRKDAAHVENVLLLGAIILIFGLPGLFIAFTVGDLIHDILIIPVMLSGHFLNKLLSGLKRS